MSTKTITKIQIDKDIELAARKIARRFGFSLEAIIDAYLMQLVHTKEVRFSLNVNIIAQKTKRFKNAQEFVRNVCS